MAVIDRPVPGGGTTHANIQHHPPNNHGQLLPEDAQCNPPKNALQNSTRRRGHTSSTTSESIWNNRSPNTEKNHTRTSLGVHPLRIDTTSQSNIASSALDAGAPPSLPLDEISNFRIQTAKSARQHYANRGPLPTPSPSSTAQTKRDNAIEGVHGTRGALPSPRGRPTKSEDIQYGEDLPNTNLGEAPPPTPNKH